MTSSLHAKIAEIQGDLTNVAKSGHNDFQRYSYATESDILAAVRPACSERGISIITNCVSYQVGNFPNRNAKGEEVLTRNAQVLVELILTDSETGESIKVQMPGYAEDTGDKAVYKAITGATKYAVWKAFAMATGDDPENDQQQPRSKPQQGRPQAVQGGNKTITDKQIGRLSTIATQAGYTTEGLKALVAQYGHSTRKSILMSQYDEICEKAADAELARTYNEAVKAS